MAFIRWKLGKCGKNLMLGKGVCFKAANKICICDDVQLRTGCQLYVQNNTMDIDKFDCRFAIILGNNVHIKENANLSTYGGYIHIGNNSNIGHNCILYGQGGIEIGQNVLVGPNCSIISGCHKFEDPNILINQQGTHDVGIKIGDDVWVGANVSILDGVNIGDGCVIGAGAVVTKDLPEYSIAYGNPARVQRKRGVKINHPK